MLIKNLKTSHIQNISGILPAQAIIFAPGKLCGGPTCTGNHEKEASLDSNQIPHHLATSEILTLHKGDNSARKRKLVGVRLVERAPQKRFLTAVAKAAA
jgi:hypothetical protein